MNLIQRGSRKWEVEALKCLFGNSLSKFFLNFFVESVLKYTSTLKNMKKWKNAGKSKVLKSCTEKLKGKS